MRITLPAGRARWTGAGAFYFTGSVASVRYGLFKCWGVLFDLCAVHRLMVPNQTPTQKYRNSHSRYPFLLFRFGSVSSQAIAVLAVRLLLC